MLIPSSPFSPSSLIILFFLISLSFSFSSPSLFLSFFLSFSLVITLCAQCVYSRFRLIRRRRESKWRARYRMRSSKVHQLSQRQCDHHHPRVTTALASSRDLACVRLPVNLDTLGKVERSIARRPVKMNMCWTIVFSTTFKDKKNHQMQEK